MPDFPILCVDDIAPDRRRGGDIRTLLSPRSVGSTSGFTGVATIAPGERIAEHYHPYSEEFLYVVAGAISAELDDTPHALRAGEGMMIPPNVRHRLVNAGPADASLVFHLGPLAPRPELGHVDTESDGGPGTPAPTPAREGA
jgi:putative monooxygenase